MNTKKLGKGLVGLLALSLVVVGIWWNSGNVVQAETTDDQGDSVNNTHSNEVVSHDTTNPYESNCPAHSMSVQDNTPVGDSLYQSVSHSSAGMDHVDNMDGHDNGGVEHDVDADAQEEYHEVNLDVKDHK